MSIEKNKAILSIIKQYSFNESFDCTVSKVISDVWRNNVDMSSRKSFPAHVTASAIIKNNNHVLMIRHKILDKWLFPGGHLELDEMPNDAAAREIVEETGYKVSPGDAILVDIDCHRISANTPKGEPAHYHIDFRYLFQHFYGHELANKNEISDIKWIDIAQLPPDYTRAAQALLKFKNI